MELVNEKVNYLGNDLVVNKCIDYTLYLSNGKRVKLDIAIENGCLTFINKNTHEKVLFELKNKDLFESYEITW